MISLMCRILYWTFNLANHMATIGIQCCSLWLQTLVKIQLPIASVLYLQALCWISVLLLVTSLCLFTNCFSMSVYYSIWHIYLQLSSSLKFNYFTWRIYLHRSRIYLHTPWSCCHISFKLAQDLQGTNPTSRNLDIKTFALWHQQLVNC